MIKLIKILLLLSLICISVCSNCIAHSEEHGNQINVQSLQNIPNIELVPFSKWQGRVLSHMFPPDSEHKGDIHERHTEVIVETVLEKTTDSPNPVPSEVETHSSSPSYIPTSTLEKQQTTSQKVNFASAECGAKVVRSNRELKSPSAVLVMNTDTYALNPCSEKIWINIELCEEVKIGSVILANLEYFSSQFKDFDLFGSLVEDNDWFYIQSFTAKNEKTPQEFIVTEAKTTYKYLKLQVNTHYGKEYYCPITYIQVYGSSLVEKLIEQVEIDQQQVENIIKLISEMNNGQNSTSEGDSEFDHNRDDCDDSDINDINASNIVENSDNIENDINLIPKNEAIFIEDCSNESNYDNEEKLNKSTSEIATDKHQPIIGQNGNESINALSQHQFESYINRAGVFSPVKPNDDDGANDINENDPGKQNNLIDPEIVDSVIQNNEKTEDTAITGLQKDEKSVELTHNSDQAEDSISSSDHTEKIVISNDEEKYNTAETSKNNKNCANEKKNSNHIDNNHNVDKPKNHDGIDHHPNEKSHKSGSNHGIVNENFMTKIASRVKQLEINQTILTSYISQFTSNITEIYKNLHAEPFHLLNSSYFYLLSEYASVNNMYNRQSQKLDTLTKDMEDLKEKYNELNENFVKLQILLDHPPNRFVDYHTLEIIVILTILVLFYYIFRPPSSGTN